MKTKIAALALLLAVSACRDNNASVELFGICSFPDTCTFSGKCGTFTLEVPTLDLAISANDQLWLAIEVHNQLQNNADPTSGRTNTNDAFVQEYAVEYEGLPLAGISGRMLQTVPANGTAVITLFPITTAVGRALTTLVTPLQNPPEAAPYRDIVAKVRVKGIYANGSEFETGSMEIPVHVCKNCLSNTACAFSAATCPPQSQGQVPVNCGG